MIQEWNKIKWLSTNCSWWCLLTAHQTKKMQAKYLTCKKQSSTKLIFTTLHSDTVSWKYHNHSVTSKLSYESSDHRCACTLHELHEVHDAIHLQWKSFHILDTLQKHSECFASSTLWATWYILTHHCQTPKCGDIKWVYHLQARDC